jgi:DNA-binding NtrC family response regulator
LAPSSRILLGGDPPNLVAEVRDALERDGVPVHLVRGAEEALKALREAPYVIVAFAERLADLHGETLLRKAARRGGKHLSVLLRAAGTAPIPADLPPDTMVLALDNPTEVVATLAAAYREQLGEAALGQIVGDTEAIRQIKQTIRQVAPTKLNVLITGESGSGKEVVARAIHELSPRRAAPFVAVNAGALPEGVLESELFGHEKGAFTGAHAARAGRFELAHRGTLFLDEIGDMPPHIQVKLLRVLEESRFLRVGGMRNIEVDVRLVAATNVELEAAVEAGRFRRDLFFRLNVIHIDVPPLRERRDDIPLLVATFVRGVAREHDLRPVRFSNEAMSLLIAHHWPGNIRELKNLVEKAAVLYAGRDIGPEMIEATFGRRIRRGANLPAPLGALGAGRGEPDQELVYRTLLALRAEVAEIRALLAARGLSETGDAGAGRALAGGAARPVGDEVPFERHGGVAADEEVVEPIDADVADEGDAERESTVSLTELERDAIARALRRTGGNRRRAARLLGVGERTLYRKIREYRLAGRHGDPWGRTGRGA